MLIPLLLTLGCTSVSGEIDGDELPITAGFYLEQEDYYGDEGLLVVFLNSADIDCEAMTELLDALDDADDADEQVEIWEETLPEDFWEMQLWMRVEDPDDDLAETELDGVGWRDSLDDDGDAAALSRHYTDHPTENSFTWWGWITGEAADYYDLSRSSGGEGKVSGYKPGEHMHDPATTEMQDDDGDDEGEVTISFSVDRCRDVEDQVF